MLRTLKSQLLVTILMLLSLSLGIMGLWLVSEFRSFYVEHVTHSLKQQALLTEVLVRANITQGDLGGLAKSVGLATGARATFIAPDGKVVGESVRDVATLDNHRNRPEVVEALEGRVGVNSRLSPTLGVPMLYTAVPVRSPTNEVVLVVRLALDLSQINVAFARIRLFTLTGGLIALLVGSVLALANAQAVSEPLQEIVTVAHRLSKGDLRSRAVKVGPVETRRLATAINTMAENLELEFQRVQLASEKIEAVLSSMRDGVVLIDSEAIIELINIAAADMLGLHADAVVGRHELLLERYPGLFSLIARARTDSNAIAERISVGGIGNRHIRATVLPLESGRVLITLQDLTEVYRAIDIRRDFVANVSHELRTPLTSLALMAENLLRGALNDKPVAEDFLRRMSGEIERLTKMVMELLQLSRLESRIESLVRSSFAAVELISDVLEGLQGLLDQKKQTVAIEGEAGLSIYADRSKLRQVLINLVDNASKFSPEQAVIVVGLRQHREEVEIYVQDNGPGIPPEQIPRVYERFFKGSSSRGGGTGLGLAIVKHIVEAHGGSVYVRSRLGEGATFGLYLPTKI